jgi:GTP-binding protein
VIWVKILDVKLTISAVRKSQFPNDGKEECLLVGRSNVGKSSFINTLINRKNFARTSAIPGKTQTLNFYLINDYFYIVDAPGYGYAKVSKSLKNKFGLIMEDYLENRNNLKMVFMLVDFRHKPTSDDILMYNYLKYYNLKVTVIATKIDKISFGQREKYKNIILKTLDLKEGDNLILFSSVTKDGKKDVYNTVEKYLDFIDD